MQLDRHSAKCDKDCSIVKCKILLIYIVNIKISEISEICFSFNDDERQYNRIKYSPSN